MHLADGTLANQICTAAAVVSAGSIVYAAARARRYANARLMARAGVGAAIVFAGQMIDVPFFGAVPIHMVGAAFLVALCGPWLALLGMTAVITVQALALHDGGVWAMGANIFNMGVVGVAVAAVCLDAARSRKGGRAGLLAGVALASAVSMAAAVVAMAAELVASGYAREVISAAIAAHAPFTLFETAATVAMVALAAHAPAAELQIDRVEK